MRLPLRASFRLFALAASVPLFLSLPDSRADDGAEFFEARVRPILENHCLACHKGSEGKRKGGLSLETRADVLAGGDSGPAAEPGEVEDSRLLEVVSYEADLNMPPKGKLSDREIRDLTRWIEMGLPWGRETIPDRAGTTDAGADFDIQQRRAAHWAWSPIGDPEPPASPGANRPVDPLDAFWLDGLRDLGLEPPAPAPRAVWLRRIAFDLTGLPPTPEELDAFLADPRPDPAAKADVVDRLLASPRFGERWARHWLDLARYSESRGHEFDFTTPNAWQYRDYVVRAFNADVPHDRFILEQIAGDLLPEPRFHPGEGFDESILGTGFWTLGEQVHSPVDIRQDQSDRIDNMIDVFGKTFLGLTIACARCHDHKFDAISARDYHALYGILESSGQRQARFDTLNHNRAVADRLRRFDATEAPRLARELVATTRSARASLPETLRIAIEIRRAVADSRARRDLAESKAAASGVSAELVALWIDRIDAAVSPSDPFRPLHRFGDPPGDERPEADAASPPNGLRPIFVPSDPSHRFWSTDEGTYGPGPVPSGHPKWSGDPARPFADLLSEPSAVADPAFDGLRAAPGSENDPSVLGQFPRAGRLIRTPTFTIGSGKILVRMRGAAQIHAAVAGHVMIQGPLHGGLVRMIPNDPPGAFRWVEIDLSAYRGIPAHLEFASVPGTDFALAEVLEEPEGGAARPDPSVWSDSEARALSSMEPSALASAFAERLERALDDWAEGRLEPGPGRAGLAREFVRRPDLFGAAEPTAAFREAARAAIDARAAIAAEVRPESRLAPALFEGNGYDERVFVRGSTRNLGELVPRRFLEALDGPEPFPDAEWRSGRLELARRVVDPATNPLTPRVAVNRVWHHLFGRGLAPTPDNLGVLGEPPARPELLDRLAADFVADGWSIKRLIRRLALSQAYGAGPDPAPATADRAEEIDPTNSALWRFPTRRLQAEAIRDAMLAVSGRLDPTVGGPPIPVHLSPFQQGRGRPASGPLDGHGRRSIYLSVRRNFLDGFLAAFDFPIPFTTVGRRSRSNVPAQSLILMNDPFVHAMAAKWAEKTVEAESEPEARIVRMYREWTGREPSSDELSACLEFLGDAAGNPGAWTELAHALLNLKEALHVR